MKSYTSTSTSTSNPPTRKLKDSCDVCSAFKLRCDKQKPTCTRCANLNRPCVYSPARRAGRPHSVRQDSSSGQSQSHGQSQSQSQSQTQQSQNQNQNQNPNSRSKSQSHSRSQSRSQSQSQIQMEAVHHHHHHHNLNHNHQQGFGGTVGEPSNPSDSRLAEPTGLPGRSHSVMGFDSSSRLPSAHTISLRHVDNTCSADIPSTPCDDFMMDTTPPHSEAASSSAAAVETDCSKLALSIVEQLETLKRRRHRSAGLPTYGGSDSGLTVTEACQRLLTILVCPCSEQAEVALLVVTACISLMDVVQGSSGAGGMGSANSADQGMVGGYEVAFSDSASSSHSSSEQDLFMWSSRPQSSSRSLPGGGGSDGQSEVRDLFKIAKVILELTDRYCQDSKGGPRWEYTTWVVAPAAALLRYRLQSVTQGATRRLIS